MYDIMYDNNYKTYDIELERTYNTPVTNSSLLPLLLMSLSLQKHTPDTQRYFMSEYDYIIVGAGAAGSTVANRLSEVECMDILLLEAGQPPPLLTEVPEFQPSFIGTDVDWGFETVPQKNTGRGLRGRRMALPRGKVIGGSTVINGLLYARGNRANYDSWAKNGAEGWSYEDVLPYFKKMEDNSNPEDVDPGFHGFHGPQTVQTPPFSTEVKEAIRRSAMVLGYRIGDANGRNQTGFYNFQGTLRNGQRCSAAKAYLVPAENRPNLDILSGAYVTKVLIEERVAVGVEFDFEGQRHRVRARKEVILSAGTTNTPKILILSGIGPRKHLQKLKIPLHSNLPVGNNFQDHCGSLVGYEITGRILPFSERVRDPRNVLKYINERRGILASTLALVGSAFLNNEDDESYPRSLPDHELYLKEEPYRLSRTVRVGSSPSYEEYLELLENRTTVWCLSSLLHPKSRGTVRLRSRDPYDSPLIDPKYYDHPQDLQDVVEGMIHCSDVLSSKPMRELGSRPLRPAFPGCEQFAEQEKLYYECTARTISITFNHQVGTARMGDPLRKDTVVDTKLRVVGIKNLRVVDASVMPTIPAGNTVAPVMMIAEKASDIIKESINTLVGCERKGV